MHFIAILLVGLVLIGMFPRAAGFIFLAVAGLIVYFVISVLEANNAREKTLKLLSIDATYSEMECSHDHPIRIRFTNSSKRSVKEYSLELIAKKVGRSDVVLSQRIRDDKIIGPGEVFSSCWSITALDQSGTVQGINPRDLVWSYRNGAVDW